MLSVRYLRRTVLVCSSLAAVLACLSGDLLAAPGPQYSPTQSRAQKSPDHITELELRHFDEFLDKHPDIRRDLARNPKLVDDPNYLVNHPDLDAFLKAHGGVRGELLKHPQEFIARERQYEQAEDRREDHVTTLELKHLDEFLDQHPNIRKDLTKDPQLVDSPDYLVNHPDLDAFLRAHGGVRGELLKHPQEFMQHEEQYEKSEKH